MQPSGKILDFLIAAMYHSGVCFHRSVFFHPHMAQENSRLLTFAQGKPNLQRARWRARSGSNTPPGKR